MKEPMVITMAREYASGGSEIAQAVADKLGIPLYNKELITLAAKKSGLTEEAIAASENQRSGSLIYSLYMMGNTMPLADQVYILQSNVIKELAAKGPCVILGRCGDYVLRERENVLRTFVYAPLEARIEFAKTRPDAKDMPDRLWETQLAKHDRARASYYNYYTENRWGEAKNYDLCLNATFGPRGLRRSDRGCCQGHAGGREITRARPHKKGAAAYAALCQDRNDAAEHRVYRHRHDAARHAPDQSALDLLRLRGCCADHRHRLSGAVCAHPRHRLHRAVHAGGRCHHGVHAACSRWQGRRWLPASCPLCSVSSSLWTA